MGFRPRLHILFHYYAPLNFDQSFTLSMAFITPTFLENTGPFLNRLHGKIFLRNVFLCLLLFSNAQLLMVTKRKGEAGLHGVWLSTTGKSGHVYGVQAVQGTQLLPQKWPQKHLFCPAPRRLRVSEGHGWVLLVIVSSHNSSPQPRPTLRRRPYVAREGRECGPTQNCKFT